MGELVAIGVDTHRDEHVAVALDGFGRDLGSLTIAASPSGYAQLWQWAFDGQLRRRPDSVPGRSWRRGVRV
jgi:hypothetical protein